MALVDVPSQSRDDIGEFKSDLRLVPDVDQEELEEEVEQDELELGLGLMTRDEVLERYFTVGEKTKGRKQESVFTKEKGADTYTANINPTDSMILPQIRNTYNPMHAESLGRSICETKAGQLQNGGVALLFEEDVDQYLEDLNEFFESDIKKDELPPFNEKLGGYLVTIFGHNRQIGIAAHNKSVNNDPDRGKQFRVKIFVAPTFWEVIEMQATENTGNQPEMYDRSRAIVQYKKLRNRDGIPPTQAELSHVFNIDKDNVWRAELYETLPKQIKKLVVAEKLVYSGAHELVRLRGYYSEEDIIRVARNMSNRKSKMSTEQIKNEVSTLLEVSDLTPEVHMMVEDGKLTLFYAQLLHRMYVVEIDDELINKTAVWLATDKPSNTKAEKGVADIIDDHLEGKREIWDKDGGLSEEKRIELQGRLRVNNENVHVREAVLDATRKIAGVISAIKSGAISSDGIKNMPTADVIAANFESLFVDYAAGRVQGLDTEIGKFLDKLEELMEVEKEYGSGEVPNKERRMQAARIIANAKLSKRSGVVQDGFFG